MRAQRSTYTVHICIHAHTHKHICTCHTGDCCEFNCRYLLAHQTGDKGRLEIPWKEAKTKWNKKKKKKQKKHRENVKRRWETILQRKRMAWKMREFAIVLVQQTYFEANEKQMSSTWHGSMYKFAVFSMHIYVRAAFKVISAMRQFRKGKKSHSIAQATVKTTN